MEIYVQKDGQKLGPFPEFKIRQGIDAGEFAPNDLAWTNGKASWQPLSDLLNLNAERSRSMPARQPPQRKDGNTAVENSDSYVAISAPKGTALPVFKPAVTSTGKLGYTVTKAFISMAIVFLLLFSNRLIDYVVSRQHITSAEMKLFETRDYSRLSGRRA